MDRRSISLDVGQLYRGFPRAENRSLQARQISFTGVHPEDDEMPLIEQGDADTCNAKATGDQRHRLRYAAMSMAGFALLAIAAVHRVDCVLESHADEYANFRKASISESVSFAALPHLHPGCDDNKTICFCSYGKDKSMEGCKQWTFKVGDVVIFEYAPTTNLETAVINSVMKEFYKGAVHAAIVTEVRGPALTEIIVTEALKGTLNQIYSSTMHDVLHYRVYHGFWIRRIDEKRFPYFKQKTDAIANWGRQRVGEPFNKVGIMQKMVPFVWSFTSSIWIGINPCCAQREKALDLYKKGGPGAWFCSQFVAWTLAFAGGINTDYGSLGSCTVPQWTGKIENLQVAPGDLIEQPVYDSNQSLYVRCPSRCDSFLLTLPSPAKSYNLSYNSTMAKSHNLSYNSTVI